MRKSLLPVLLLTVFVTGCAHNSPKPDPLPPTQAEPPFAIAQGALLLVFVVLAVLAGKRFRPLG